MDWEKKFNSIIRDTDANLEKVKSRVMLSGGGSSRADRSPLVGSSRADRSPLGGSSRADRSPLGGSSRADRSPLGGPADPTADIAELQASVRQQAAEIRRLSSCQHRQDLENEYIRVELSRLRKDLRKLTPPPEPAQNRPGRSEPGSAVREGCVHTTQGSAATDDSATRDDLARRLAQLERRVTVMEEARKMDMARPFAMGTSPLACVDDHFPPEAEHSPRTSGTGFHGEPLNFNLDDLALSDSDDH